MGLTVNRTATDAKETRIEIGFLNFGFESKYVLLHWFYSETLQGLPNFPIRMTLFSGNKLS